MKNKDRVLLAAAELGPKGEPFTVFDLTVRAWIANKLLYGMPGYEMVHPNHQKVYVATLHLLGRNYRRLTYPGYLKRCGRNLLQLTQAGIDRAAKLRKELDATSPTA